MGTSENIIPVGFALKKNKDTFEVTAKPSSDFLFKSIFVRINPEEAIVVPSAPSFNNKDIISYIIAKINLNDIWVWRSDSPAQGHHDLLSTTVGDEIVKNIQSNETMPLEAPPDVMDKAIKMAFTQISSRVKNGEFEKMAAESKEEILGRFKKTLK